MQTTLTSASPPRLAPEALRAFAVILDEPERLSLSALELDPPGPEDVVVDVQWSGISTGTERLLWSGRMPMFPGMGYPLVPGYESVGRVAAAGPASGRQVGDQVFVPGASCYGEVRGLFGGAASRVVVSGSRVAPIDAALGEQGTLLALAATARHAIRRAGALPELIVGHGVLGRLLARLVLAEGGRPVVWEQDPRRQSGARGYAVLDAAQDPRADYRVICDVSGDSQLLDTLVSRLARGGELLLAGFYTDRPSFAFPPAFMREISITVAAEWQPSDLAAVQEHLDANRLSLDGLISHRQDARQAARAYRTAFTEADCLKMILDWRDLHE